ncbi:thioredoxin-related transmembrane protein 1 isoform X2 [Lacerta agilis]|uniref:thioredoxin-related transmembrane protein 1 isoform X2 n=1 Tax=Lacerta agilis TaxID=80427 RepID=UPI0014197335|nr:thioredoxin-related transmembrane protein 1 isoform X2 [Lacerta agilis]
MAAPSSYSFSSAPRPPSPPPPLPLRLLFLLLVFLAAGPARAGRSRVRSLSDGSWRELLQGEWMVEFYAPWCPACQNLQPEWESFAEWGEDLEINIAKVDVTEQPGLSGRFIITALPTIYHCKDGEFRRYQGPRTKTDFINFISDQEWKSNEPISSWFGPSSFLMSSMSALFQLSMWIRIMVFLADCICPSKKHRPLQHHYQRKLPESTQLLQKADEELEEDDLPDAEVEHREPPNALRQRAANPVARAGAEQS